MTAPIMATKNGTAASGMNYDQVYRLTTHGSNRLGGNATADVLTFGQGNSFAPAALTKKAHLPRKADAPFV